MYHIKVQAQVSGLPCPLPKSTLRSLRGAWASRLGGSTQIPTIWPWGESPRNQIIHEALRMMILNHQEKEFLSAWRRLFPKLVYIFWSKGGFWDSDILDFIIPVCFQYRFQYNILAAALLGYESNTQVPGFLQTTTNFPSANQTRLEPCSKREKQPKTCPKHGLGDQTKKSEK